MLVILGAQRILINLGRIMRPALFSIFILTHNASETKNASESD